MKDANRFFYQIIGNTIWQGCSYLAYASAPTAKRKQRKGSFAS
ncbi:MAG: hypothetical protein PHT62_06215 [Desulfotomaculaceae bacterium]|nr:hypothetical protein [Desulfotomaculaceae bacterium]